VTAYSNAVRDFVNRYSVEAGPDALLDPHAIAEWAYNRGLYKPNARTVIDAIATDIAQVFREEYRVDRNGRRYRAKHAATEKRGTKTIALWGDMDDPNVPPAPFTKSFAQPPQRIGGDCMQLKTDVDVYNDKRQPSELLQVPLDFTLDVEEMQLRAVSKAA